MATKPDPPPEPVDFVAVFAAALRAGGFFYGQAAEELRIRTEDGEWRRIWLPEPTVVETAAGVNITRTRGRILAALKKEPAAVTRKRLGQLVGRSASGGKFGLDIRYLIENRLCFQESGFLTDDPKKLPPMA